MLAQRLVRTMNDAAAHLAKRSARVVYRIGPDARKGGT
jgi:hypothetical protein